MSYSYIDKILLNPKKNNPYSHMRPAVKDSNFYFINCISFNIVESLTQFKNKEFSSTKLNAHLLCNLSFLFAKKNITTKLKIIKEKTQKNNNNINNNKKANINKKVEEEFRIIEGYECFIPTKRISYFNRRPLTEKTVLKKESSKSINRQIQKEIKIPLDLKNINFFLPAGRFFTFHKNNSNINHNKNRIINSLSSKNILEGFPEGLSNSSNSSNSIKYSNSNSNINIDDIKNDNSSSGDYSFIYGEVDDNIFHEKSFIDILETSPTFPKYSELCDLIECPLDDVFSSEMKIKNYIKIFNEIMNEEDYDDNLNNNINNHYFSNDLTIISNNNNSINNLNKDNIDDNIHNENKKVFIINPSKYSPCTNSLNSNNFQERISKSGQIMKITTNTSSKSTNIDKTFHSDDNEDSDDYIKEESLFAFFDNNKVKKKNPQVISTIKSILPKSALKYINKMSNKYILLMCEQYKKLCKKLKEAQNYLHNEIILKQFFLQLLKRFLLNIGISTKKCYEKLTKYVILSREPLNFEYFMSIFELILIDNNKENLRFKFLFLLKIIRENDAEQILDENKMNVFFDLIECEWVYINNFCELLGERLVLRYKAFYNNKKLDKNITDKIFIYRKIKNIMESFLDLLDSKL